MNTEIRELLAEEIPAVSGAGTTKTWDGKEMVTANFVVGDKVIVISATSDWNSCAILKR